MRRSGSDSVRGFLYRILVTLWSEARKLSVPAWIKNYRAWIFQAYVIVALIAFSLLALMANVFEYTAVDLAVTKTLQQDIPPWMSALWVAVSWPGYFPQIAVVIALPAIILGMVGLRWEAATVLFTAVTAGALNYLVKVAIRRPRPSADLVTVVKILDSYSFPSGHVMFYTAFFGFLMFLVYIQMKHAWRRTLLLVILGALVAMIGISRMYLGEHWASDVLGGYLLGSLSLLLGILFYRWGKASFFPVDPLSTDDEPPIGKITGQ